MQCNIINYSHYMTSLRWEVIIILIIAVKTMMVPLPMLLCSGQVLPPVGSNKSFLWDQSHRRDHATRFPWNSVLSHWWSEVMAQWSWCWWPEEQTNPCGHYSRSRISPPIWTAIQGPPFLLKIFLKKLSVYPGWYQKHFPKISIRPCHSPA